MNTNYLHHKSRDFTHHHQELYLCINCYNLALEIRFTHTQLCETLAGIFRAYNYQCKDKQVEWNYPIKVLLSLCPPFWILRNWRRGINGTVVWEWCRCSETKMRLSTRSWSLVAMVVATTWQNESDTQQSRSSVCTLGQWISASVFLNYTGRKGQRCTDSTTTCLPYVCKMKQQNEPLAWVKRH